MKNCTFRNNTSDGYFTSKPYQGSSGGLSIGYNSSNIGFIDPQIYDTIVPSFIGPTGNSTGQDYPVPEFIPPPQSILDALIINCTFTNNSAVLLHGQTGSSTDSLINKTFPGRGGALSVLVNAGTALNFVFNDNRVINNFASAFGGGVYCLTLRGTRQDYTFGNNVFINNTASVAGGLALIYLVSTIAEFPVDTLVNNCTFYNNAATSVAGAIAIVFVFGFDRDVFVIFKDCKFFSNTAVIYGGAVDITSYNFFNNIQTTSLIDFINWLVATYCYSPACMLYCNVRS